MLCRNLSHLIVGILLGAVVGAILGMLVCDETKKSLEKLLSNRLRLLSGNLKNSSERAIDVVKNSVAAARGSVKDLL